MAQYGLGYYGQAMYGMYGAVSGEFISDEVNIEAGMPISTKIKVISTDPKCAYLYNDSMFVYTGDWEIYNNRKRNTSLDSSVSFYVTSKIISLKYVGSATCNIKILDTVSGTYKDIDTNATTTLTANSVLGETILQVPEYAAYMITITPTVINGIEIDSMYAYCSSCDISIRYGNTESELASSSFSKLSLESTSIDESSIRTYIFDAASLYNKKWYQYKLDEYCSDDEHDIYIKDINVYANTSNIYAGDASYFAEIVMPDDFASYSTITWTEDVDRSDCKLDITTQTGTFSGLYGQKSYPYRLNDSYIVLTNGSTEGSMIVKPYTSLYAKNTSLIDISYIIPQLMKPGVFSIDYQMVSDTNSDISGVFNASRKVNEIPIPSTFKLKINMTVGSGDMSPAILSSNVVTYCEYIEDKTINKTISAVEENKDLGSISSLSFNVPTQALAGGVKYEIKNMSTEAPYVLYFNDGETGINRHLDITTSDTNINIIGRSTMPISVQKRAMKIYNNPSGPEATVQISNVFSPQLDSSKKYMYKIINGESSVSYNEGITETYFDMVSRKSVTIPAKGWYAVSIDPDSIDIPTVYKFKSTNTIFSTTSEVNLKIAGSDDSVIIESSFNDEATIKDWSSEEKINTCEINVDGNYKITSIDNIELPYIDKDVYISDLSITKSDILENSIAIGPYNIEILDGTVFCVPKSDSYISVETSRIKIKSFVANRKDSYKNGSRDDSLKRTDLITRGYKLDEQGNPVDYDDLGFSFVKSDDFIGVYDVVIPGYTCGVEYIKGTDYYYDEQTHRIIWQTSGNKPIVGTQYLAVYYDTTPDSCSISFECDYYEEYKETDIWKSFKCYKMSGTCSPGKDYILKTSLLPAINTSNFDLPSNVTNLRYVIDSSTNPYVSLSMKNDTITGTLGNIKPSEDWLLSVNNGYYYINKDEYYMYSNPTTITANTDVPFIDNCEYTSGDSLNSGAIISHDSFTNYILNSEYDLNKDDICFTPNINNITIIKSSSKTINWE